MDDTLCIIRPPMGNFWMMPMVSSGPQSVKIVWALLENGQVPYGQKAVDGGCKCKVGMRQTEVRLDGWHEGGLGQQSDGGGGCMTMHERWLVVQSSGAHVDNCV